jgi:hypothetical protein
MTEKRPHYKLQFRIASISSLDEFPKPRNPLATFSGLKNRLACVASCAKMIDGIFKLHPQQPRHSSRIAGTIANVTCLDLTPISLSHV